MKANSPRGVGRLSSRPTAHRLLRLGNAATTLCQAAVIVVLAIAAVSSPAVSATSTPSPSDIDSFLRRMSSTKPDNCSMENLGPGVVQGLARERFKRQAMIAVTRANLLTYLWKYNPDYLYRESVLYWLVSNLVESDDDIFAAGNCYDFNQFKSFGIFCPYAFRNKKDGAIIVKDLAKTHHYENELSTEHEWFHEIRRIGLRIINNTKLRKESVVSFFLPNEDTNKTYSTLVVNYDDGHWSLPYYDCGGGNIWMITYTVPFFGYDRIHRSYTFKGTSGIDIDLMEVDINQCSPNEIHYHGEVNVFANTHKCKASTICSPLMGLGFQRGSYKCFCRDGYYFPLQQRGAYDEAMKGYYFNGTDLEEEYDKMQDGDESRYDSFECVPCAPGCDTCEDGRPCLFPINWVLRGVLLAVIGLMMLSVCGWSVMIRMFQDFKPIKAASPLLLQIILAGALLSYTPMIVHFFEPNAALCTIQFWPREIGFATIYASILFKTWRIAVVFRPTKYRNVRITDMMLLKRIAMVVLAFVAFCIIRTIIGRPEVVMVRHSSGMKTFSCNFDVWDYSIAGCKLLFLIWGVWLSILVHKTPSEFNESRFISWAIYNETILSIFFTISMVFLHSSGNPDLFYILVFLHSQLTVTGTTAFLFASKAYHLVKAIRSGETRELQKSRRFVQALASKSSMTHHSGAKTITRQVSMCSADLPSFIEGAEAIMNKELASHTIIQQVVTVTNSPQSVRASSSVIESFKQRKESSDELDGSETKKPQESKTKQTKKKENIAEQELLLPRLSQLQEQIEAMHGDVGRNMSAPSDSPKAERFSSKDIKSPVEKSKSTAFDAPQPFIMPCNAKISKTMEVHLELNGLTTPSKSRSESSCKSPSSGTNTLNSTHSSRATDDYNSSVENGKMNDSESSPSVIPQMTMIKCQVLETAIIPNGIPVALKITNQNGFSHEPVHATDSVSSRNGVHHEIGNGITMDDTIISKDEDHTVMPSTFAPRRTPNAVNGPTSRVWVKRNGAPSKAPVQGNLSQPVSNNTKSVQAVENVQQTRNNNVVNCVQFTYV